MKTHFRLLLCTFILGGVSVVGEVIQDLKKQLQVTVDTKDIRSSPYYKDKVLSLPISKESGEELWQHWTDQAFSGLISSIATRRLHLVEKYDRKKHEKCSAKAHDIKSHAKCLVNLEKDGLENHWLKRKKFFDQKTRKSIEKKSLVKFSSNKLKKLKSLESYEASKSVESKKRRRILKSSSSESYRKLKMTSSENSEGSWIGSFKTARRAKRSIVLKNPKKLVLKPKYFENINGFLEKLRNTNSKLWKLSSMKNYNASKLNRSKRSIPVKNAKSYIIKGHHEKSPFSIITKNLVNTVKALKKKEKLSKWQDIISRIQKEGALLKKKKEDERLRKSRLSKILKIPSLKTDGRLKNFSEMEKQIEDEELREIYHQKTSNMTDEEKMMMIPIDIIRQAAKIGLTLSGHNTTEFDKKTLKLISPKFMSVLPGEKEDKEVDVLSPSLFSLHDSGNELEQKLSLKSLVGSGMNPEDSQNFIDLLVEATGVAEAVEDAEQKMIDAQRKKDDAMGRGPDGQPLYFTKENITNRFPSEVKKIEVFEKLDKTYTSDQLKDMNQTGYTILTPKQMLLVYGRMSPFWNPKLLRAYNNMTRAEITRAIHNTIENVAEEKLKFEIRQKDIILSPVVNTALINAPQVASQALILSPAVFVALINSPAIFGSVILSPWLFVPLILSPRILSPVILDPFMFVPIILSPVALDPVVLSPGVFNPFVLSPLLLCPFILSPQVMTPLILSPFALTPLILTPLALSPIILSPFVLSPQILSPQYVSGLFLSPYALSPSVASTGAMFTVFASPSWLS